MVRLIFICDTTTNSTVMPSTQAGSRSTYEKPVRYICVGSIAWLAGISCCSARKARNAPPIIFSMPGTIQPGPATSTAVHQRPRLAAVFSGRKRR
ncbi:hypothetical protein D9M68_733920 [compost metagenome]